LTSRRKKKRVQKKKSQTTHGPRNEWSLGGTILKDNLKDEKPRESVFHTIVTLRVSCDRVGKMGE